MHLTGKAKDKNGTVYYVVKNSWKPEINRFGGYNHLSLEYLKAKTISILVHKDAVPAEILKKIGLLVKATPPSLASEYSDILR